MLTNKILMVSPLHFRSNEETASSNTFQSSETYEGDLLRTVQKETKLSHELLHYIGVEVVVVQDAKDIITPDSIFPNNWFSTHTEISEKRTIIFYPMMAKNRRLERRDELKKFLIEQGNYEEVIDLSSYEEQGLYLEGTGSLILDRKNKIAYAALSERTNMEVIKEWEKITGYKTITFSTKHPSGVAIYHSNVLMSMGVSTAVICPDIFANEEERSLVCSSLHTTGKEIVEISLEQLENFAANILLVQTSKGSAIWICSARAFGTLTDDQKQQLRKDGELQMIPVSTIETFGGGSARCMVAELF
ncbi:MAG: amidinotransferase [Candidatus Kapabacteria bacterium]|nr:amidinotransferase [Candidatus Kapabacteria bacterium]